MTVGHIGDSRLYRLRDGEFEQVTRDHSLLQEQIDSGMITKEQARRSQNKNLVTRALGIDPTVEPEVHDLSRSSRATCYLLCSDGLNDMVEDEDIRLTLQARSAANLPAGRAAAGADGERQRGARQRIGDTGPSRRDLSRPSAGWMGRLKAWFR